MSLTKVRMATTKRPSRDAKKPSKLDAEKPTPKEQSARFIEAARELGCDESPDAFEAGVKKVARHKPVEERPSKPHVLIQGGRD